MKDFTQCKDCLNICDCCKFQNIKCALCKPFSSMFQVKNSNRCNCTTRYLPGDKVIVRPDLEYRKYAMLSNSKDSIIAIPSMTGFAGKTVTISSVEVCSFQTNKPMMYKIKEHGGYWTDEMFIGRAYEHEL